MRNKMKKEQVKQFLVNKYTKEWMKENKEFVADYQQICELVLLFHANWGINIGLTLNKVEETKGRGLGVGVVEELFDGQEETLVREK